MSFKRVTDEYITECLQHGGLPNSKALMEVNVDGCGGPRAGDKPGPQGSHQQATMSDHVAPPNFAGASRDKKFPPPKFSDQNRAAPPAMFNSAARLEDMDPEVISSVFDDLSVYAENDEDAEEDEIGESTKVADLLKSAGEAISKNRKAAWAATAGSLATGVAAHQFADKKLQDAKKRGDVKAIERYSKLKRGLEKGGKVASGTAALLYGGHKIKQSVGKAASTAAEKVGKEGIKKSLGRAKSAVGGAMALGSGLASITSSDAKAKKQELKDIQAGKITATKKQSEKEVQQSAADKQLAKLQLKAAKKQQKMQARTQKIKAKLEKVHGQRVSAGHPESMKSLLGYSKKHAKSDLQK